MKFYSILTFQMKSVCDAFLDLFSNLFSLVLFLKLWLSLLLNMQKKNKNNYERAESEETNVRVHSFMMSAKSLKFDHQPPHPLYA